MSATNEPTRYTREWLDSVLGAKVTPLLEPHSPRGDYGPAYPRKVGAGDGETYVGAAVPAQGLGLKDHEIARCVNELRSLAMRHGAGDQLRERIAHYLAPILRGERRP